jgi:hypothetical protein
LILQYGRYSLNQLSKHHDAILNYAKKIGPQKALQTYSLVDYICSKRNIESVPILADWLDEETNDRQAENFAMYISKFPDTDKYLLKTLRHKCPSAVKFTANVLAHKYPQQVTDALTSLLDRRTKEGANTTELSDIRNQLTQVKGTKQPGEIKP